MQDAIAAVADMGEGRLRCAACGREVTRLAQARTVRGAHVHDLRNPAGIDFRVRCFSSAPGARSRGTQTAAHSWFPPARWTVAACRACDLQLGWFFHDQDDSFAALIEARLSAD